MRSVRLADPRAQRVHLALGQPAGGLVEQQEAWLRHEGPGQRGPLLDGVGQRGRESTGVVGRPELVEDLHGPGRDPALLPARPPQAEERRCQVAAEPRLGAEHDVLVHGQPGAQPDALEGAGDPELRQVVRMVPAQDPAAVADRARARVDEAADHVEQRRFAGAVRSDDADDLAVADRHRHIVEGQQTAEADADLIDHEERRVGLLSLPVFGWRSRGLEDRAHRRDYPGREAASINAGRAPEQSCLTSPPASLSNVTALPLNVTAFDLRVPGLRKEDLRL